MEIEHGKKVRATIILLYSAPGVGKSSMASQSDKPLFADLENGTDFLDVSRVKPKTFAELLKVFFEFEKTDFQTLVIDSLSAMERLAIEHTLSELKLQNPKIESLEDLGYGKGYAALRVVEQRFLNACEWLRNHGKNVVILAHSRIKSIVDPSLDTFDRHEFEIDKNMVSTTASICDGVFYLRPQIRVSADKNKSNKATTAGGRELIMSDSGGVLSKSRFDLDNFYEFENQRDEKKRNEMYRKFWFALLNTKAKEIENV